MWPPRWPASPFELVLVDDGSTDGTSELLARLAAADPRVRVVPLSRNFGHQVALTAGLDHARGDPVVMLDADLQDPPELIPEMLEHWREGTTSSTRCARERAGETAFKRAHRALFYRLFGRLAHDRPEPERRRLPAARPARRSRRCSRCASAAASCAG